MNGKSTTLRCSLGGFLYLDDTNDGDAVDGRKRGKKQRADMRCESPFSSETQKAHLKIDT